MKTGDAEAVRELLNFGLLNKDVQQACTGMRLFFFSFFSGIVKSQPFSKSRLNFIHLFLQKNFVWIFLQTT